MTQFIRKSDGSWCGKKITLGCTVIGTLAAVIGVMPTAFGYVQKITAPWVSFPTQLEEMRANQGRLEVKVDRIAEAVGAQVTFARTTNNLPYK